MGLLLQDMTVLNTEAARRNESFRTLRKKYAWRTAGVGENIEVSLGEFRGFVVPEASARHDMDLFSTIDADHFQICRPESRISNSFQRLNFFVADVLKEDNIRFPPEMDFPAEVVALESQTEQVEEMLQMTKRVGIVGMGGIGKTTLAKAVFDAISGKFEYACFVHKIKYSMTKDKQPIDLRRTIIQNLYCRGRKVSSTFDWTTLKGKRVLIILDDAELVSQVDVMTEIDRFSPKSRLIVTSRDKGFLIPEDFSFHKVEALSLDDSQVLFCLHAFKKRISPRAYEAEVMKFAKKCGGLPLALKVSGRYVYTRKKDTWDDAFKKLGRAESLNGSREDGLWSILRVSYDSLAPIEQKMFLDAATVFHGDYLLPVQRLWRRCGWAALSGWENLLDRCLVSISDAGNINVHEVLRDLGYSIACPDPEDVTTHTRVYDINTANRLREVLSARRQRGQGTIAKVEVLNLARDKTSDHFDISVIQGLEHLRILLLSRLKLHGSMDVSPNMVLAQAYFDMSSFLQRRHAPEVYSLPEAFCKLVSLRFLDLSNYSNETLPDGFGQLRALEELLIYQCKELTELPDSIGQLQELSDLRIISCPSLRALPESFGQLRALRRLKILHCDTLETLPESFGDLRALNCMCIKDCLFLMELPQSVRKLETLQYLSIDTTFSANPLEYFGQLETLRVLQITTFLASSRLLMESLGQIRTLECLLIDGDGDYGSWSETTNHLQCCSLSESLGQLRALKHLKINDCDSLTNLPLSLGQLVALERLEVRGCRTLEDLPESLGQLQALECLSVSVCDSLTRLPESIRQLRALRCMKISHCRNLESLPESLGQLHALESLEVDVECTTTNLPESLRQRGALREVVTTLETVFQDLDPISCETCIRFQQEFLD